MAALSNPALLANVEPRVIAILNANPGAFSATVSGKVGAFPSDAEIRANVLAADEMVVTQGYFQSKNAALAEPFIAYSANIPHGGNIPFYYGRRGKVLLSTDNFASSNILGTESKSKDDIVNHLLFGATGYFGTTDAFDHIYFIDDETATFYHAAPNGKIELPVFTRSIAAPPVLQSNKSEETLIVATAVRLLTRHASPAAFAEWRAESITGIEQLKTDGAYTESEAVKH